MQTAAAAQLPHHLLVGWVHLAQRLHALGIAVRHVDMPAEDLGELDEAAGQLWVRADADPGDQVWLMQQAWNFLAIGPHASPTAQIQPRLHLVLPQQRAGAEAPDWYPV